MSESTTSAVCFARRHMSPAASAFHSYAFAVSQKSGIFYSDDRRDANEFGECGVSSHTIFDLRSFLEHKGWMVPIDKGKRKRNPATGHFLPIRYRVLNHDEWSAKHPGHCRSNNQVSPDAETAAGPDAKTAAGNQSPDAEKGVHLMQFCPAPDAETAAKQVKRDSKESVKEIPPIVPPNGGTAPAPKTLSAYDLTPPDPRWSHETQATTEENFQFIKSVMLDLHMSQAVLKDFVADRHKISWPIRVPNRILQELYAELIALQKLSAKKAPV